MKDCSHIVRSLIWLTLLALVWPLTAAQAMDDRDEHPPMRWAGMLSCHEVIVGTYAGHEGKTLSLHVLRVLRGSRVKPGDRVSLSLQNRYSLQTGAVGFDAMFAAAQRPKPDAVPKLCYQVQFGNPGGLVPSPILSDARHAAIYFLPDDGAPALARSGQVQPAVLADGWQQAISGQPMSLAFRLAQSVNPTLRRDAQEELFVSRDPATLDWLFQWGNNPPQPALDNIQETLVAIGDRHGDVYNRAQRLFLHWANQNEAPIVWRYDFVPGQIMAQVDPRRAFRDFSQMSASGSKIARASALGMMDFVGNEQALDFAFSLLHQPDSAEWGISTLRGILSPGLQWPQPHLKADRLSHLRRLARPRLEAALALSMLTEKQKQEMTYAFSEIIAQPPRIDLAQAETVLLNPTGTTYAEIPWEVKDTSKMRPAFTLLENIRKASDPKFIPLLVKILHDIPQAGKDSGYGNALLFYAELCPHAMQRQRIAQGVTYKFAQTAGLISSGYYVELRRILGDAPQNEEELFQTTAQLKDHDHRPFQPSAVPPSVLAELKPSVESALSTPASPGFYLEQLFFLAPAEANPLLNRALAERHRYSRRDQIILLSLAMQYQHKKMANELLPLFQASHQEAVAQQRRNPSFWGYFPDPDAAANRDPLLFQAYLEHIDASKRLSYDQGNFQDNFTNRQFLDSRYRSMVAGLFPAHAANFFTRVLALLSSPSLPEREGGEQMLLQNLRWNFGFNSSAFKAERAVQIARLRPMFKTLSALSEKETRAFVLNAHGITLPGAPSRTWLPTLSRAALDLDPAVSLNALLLIEAVVNDPGCSGLANFSPAIRKQALSAYFADRGVAETLN